MKTKRPLSPRPGPQRNSTPPDASRPEAPKSRWDASRDKTLLGRIVKGRHGKEQEERFRWQVRIYDGGAPRIVTWREFMGRGDEWIVDIESRATVRMPLLGSIVKGAADIAAAIMGAQSSAATAPQAPPPAAHGEEREDDIPF